MDNFRHVCWHDEGDTAESRLKETLFCVEATSFERFTLWSRWCAESQEQWKPLFEKWEQLGGWLVTVGELDDRPVCVSMDWVRMDGHLIMFWKAVSQVVDQLQVEAWFTEHFDRAWGGGRQSMTDASNFHFAVAAIDEARNQPEG